MISLIVKVYNNFKKNLSCYHHLKHEHPPCLWHIVCLFPPGDKTVTGSDRRRICNVRLWKKYVLMTRFSIDNSSGQIWMKALCLSFMEHEFHGYLFPALLGKKPLKETPRASEWLTVKDLVTHSHLFSSAVDLTWLMASNGTGHFWPFTLQRTCRKSEWTRILRTNPGTVPPIFLS